MTASLKLILNIYSPIAAHNYALSDSDKLFDNYMPFTVSSNDLIFCA